MSNGKKSNSWTMEEVHKKVDMRRFRHNEVNLEITYVAVEHRSPVKSRTRSLQWYAGSGFLTLGSVPPLFYLGGLMISYPSGGSCLRLLCFLGVSLTQGTIH